MNSFRNLKRTDLFLVRMWTADVLDSDDGRGTAKTEWRGKVQRVVDGEAHQFSDWQGLADLLTAMLSNGEEARQLDGTHLKNEGR